MTIASGAVRRDKVSVDQTNDVVVRAVDAVVFLLERIEQAHEVWQAVAEELEVAQTVSVLVE